MFPWSLIGAGKKQTAILWPAQQAGRLVVIDLERLASLEAIRPVSIRQLSALPDHADDRGRT